MSIALALIGLKGHQYIVLEALPGLPEVELVAVANDDPEALKEVPALPGRGPTHGPTWITASCWPTMSRTSCWRQARTATAPRSWSHAPSGAYISSPRSLWPQTWQAWSECEQRW